MSYDFEDATRKYKQLADQIDRINMQAKQQVAELRREMGELEHSITEAADMAGLKTVPTEYGTAYWSVLSNCSVASPEAFFQHCLANQSWELLEKRASKTAVKEYIDEHGEPPPGISYSTFRKFNLRRNRDAEA